MYASQCGHLNNGEVVQRGVEVAFGWKEGNPCLRRESNSDSPVILPRKCEVNIKLDGTETRETKYALRDSGARFCSHYCHGRAISITYSECVFVALGIQHTKRVYRIILPSMACPAVPYFSTLFMNDTIPKKNYRPKYVFLDILYNFFCSISHYKKNSA